MAKKLTSTKAKQILHDKEVHGHPLTDKQRKFFGAVASGAVPKAQEGTPVKSFYKDAEDKKQYQNAIQNWYRNTLPNLSREERLSIIPEESIKRSLGENDTGLRCIGGACSIMKKHGKTFNAGNVEGIYTGNGTFETNAFIKNLEDVYQVDGNYQIGDLIQVPPKKGLYGDTKLIVDINDGKIITYGGVSGGDISPGTVYTPEELSRYVKDGTRRVVRPGYQLDRELLQKERKAKTSPEARKAINQRKENIAYQEGFNPGYQYSVREDSELYGNEPEGVKEFLKLANDDTRVTDIIKRLDKAGLASKADKLSVHNSLLNVFGILGQENKFENRLFGGDFGVENLIERNIYDGLIPTPGAEGNLSIGPGQIKFSSINPEIRKAFGIKKPKDLYNWDKVLPLMVGMDISNRKWMENQGKKLSERIIGEPGAGSTDMIWDEARMSPYFWQGPGIPNLREFLSKKYDEYVEGYRIPKKVKEAQREEYISKNIRKYQKVFDPESYGQKVYENINKNLQRTSPNLENEQTLQEIVIPIKKKKQNGGWLNKYEVPEAQNGIEGTMGGLTDVGFDYNGAWGGTMAMGGSLPGSVGMMYARTGAPSNGPYAKKTKASAQNGMEMKYYQEGLDFQPKTISRDGSDIPKAQTGISSFMPEGLRRLPTNVSDNTKAIISQRDLRTEKEAEYENRMRKAKENIVRQAEPKRSSSSKAFAIATNPMTALAYKMKGQDIPENFERGETNILEYATNAINPFSYVDQARQIKQDIGQGNYLAAGLGIIGLIPGKGAFGRSSSKFLHNKKGIDDVGKNLDEIYKNRTFLTDESKGIKNIPWNTKTNKSIQNEFIDEQIEYMNSPAFVEKMKTYYPDVNIEQYKKAILHNLENKITSTTKSYPDASLNSNVAGWYVPKENLPNNTFIMPGYKPSFASKVRLANEEMINPAFQYHDDAGKSFTKTLGSTIEHELGHQRTNANWLLPDYLTKEYLTENLTKEGNMLASQEANSPFGFFNYHSNPTEFDTRLLNMKKDLKRQGIIDYTKSNDFTEELLNKLDVSNSRPTNIAEELKEIEVGFLKGDYTKEQYEKLKNFYEKSKNLTTTSGDFTVTKDTKDLLKYWNTKFLAEEMKKLPAILPYIGIGGAGVLGAGALEQKKQGGVIKDDMGYWNPENWGKPVEIDSNEITMQGVYEPLLGVSDTGDTQMMYPGEDYTFDGESVTEYPVARRGTSVNNADAQPIKKLNQLMNFSNYNKPTKGGWLSKYE